MSSAEPFILVYDGGCPFCSYLALRSELSSGLPNLQLVDGRLDQELRLNLRRCGLNLADGAVLIEGDQAWHGAEAVSMLCQRMQPDDAVLSALKALFARPKRAQHIYPLLLLVRRLLLRCRGLPEDPDQIDRVQDFT